jgi:hypothetical protein
LFRLVLESNGSFAGLVFSQQFLCFIDVPLLPALGTTAKKNDQRFTVFCEEIR